MERRSRSGQGGRRCCQVLLRFRRCAARPGDWGAGRWLELEGVASGIFTLAIGAGMRVRLLPLLAQKSLAGTAPGPRRTGDAGVSQLGAPAGLLKPPNPCLSHKPPPPATNRQRHHDECVMSAFSHPHDDMESADRSRLAETSDRHGLACTTLRDERTGSGHCPAVMKPPVQRKRNA